jgi:hypothetical protein
MPLQKARGKTKMIIPGKWRKAIFVAAYRPHTNQNVTSLRIHSSCNRLGIFLIIENPMSK